ncbi:unnamed protein product [Rotaria socialis]|uniref:Intraflagellar transport protein 56 n=1 Tax=Rotaria socialis TaxID=392032 RepID=A0A817TRW4_9BILA|nr:unnamed protein product [Rotaria socialis]CAF3326501.1 unnamed protein product [Rotaria socialis]CAF3607159.1 unnamed protein product [Rotaria socialis]CAF3761648.1 unnamed protein product [Rotaria socialis]CAF3773200.1 unnamed protein product [Rotaria socialis]
MILSRTKAADDPKKKGATPAQEKNKKKVGEVEDFIAERDYTGAIAYLEFCRQSGKEVKDLDLWLGFAAFHAGDYQRASEEYENILKNDPRNSLVYIYLACCYFMLGKYDDAEQTAAKGPKSALQTRVLFHVAHKQNNEEKLMGLHRQLQDVIEDQMCLASMHYMRSHFQEALDIYKRYLVENRDYLALNVYVALCYYKLDYYDISQEVLDVYLKKNPESATATNLQACNQYRLYNGKAAENDLKQFLEKMSTSFNYAKELFRHNMVVFQNGEGALQVLPPLVDVIPEARLNLVIYYLKEDDLDHAYDLMKDVEPLQPAEYILKGVVNAAYGQEHNSRDHIKTAQSYFQLVGGSASECDTIPGRQSMAACYFLHKRFDDVIVYLSSIKTYFYNDDTFNFNYGQAKAHEEKWKEAEEAFLLIQSEKLKNDYVYLSWLARCYIYNGKPRLAWELYLKLEHSNESFSLLQLIANDCYKRGHFFYAARGFDILERMDPNPEFWEGKQGACAGAFQQIVAGHEPRDTLRDILSLLRNTNHPQGEQMIKIMRSWARTNNIPV